MLMRIAPQLYQWCWRWSANLGFRSRAALRDHFQKSSLGTLSARGFAFSLVGCLSLTWSSHQIYLKCNAPESLDAEDSNSGNLVQLADASPRCRRFIAWLFAKEIEVVVFDMDLTMGSGHCGPGLKREDLGSYIAGASPDFVEAIQVVSRIPGIRLAVATNSDPAEYDLPGQSRESHILGPDLAYELIRHWCPESLSRFEIMVGFDHDCHKDEPVLQGKSWHMRRIADHYKMPFHKMVLIDDTPSRLENIDGWHGVLVRDQLTGFHFEDCFVDDCLPPRLRARQRRWKEPFMRGFCEVLK